MLMQICCKDEEHTTVWGWGGVALNAARRDGAETYSVTSVLISAEACG